MGEKYGVYFGVKHTPTENLDDDQSSGNGELSGGEIEEDRPVNAVVGYSYFYQAKQIQ
ncbi:MAG: hypothetical protein GXP04_05245 [Alphaproteobacteria bacterium]|nr:hypothetical protein [Alphaproteobacteria bacterium]